MIETMIGNSIANQCSPVLMDVKPSNLLILTREEEERFLEMEDIPGIWEICLHRGEQKSIWLLYRKDRLEALLLWPGTGEFLKSYGYQTEESTLDQMLARLAERFTEYKEGRAEFPHEMGAFLGYPLSDVKGFIEHEEKDFLCSGYWKVYSDETGAKKTFQLYQAVRNMVLQMLSAGSSLCEISCQAY